MTEPIAEILIHTPVSSLDAAVARQMEHAPYDEVRKALVEVIKRTPMDEFAVVRDIYWKHFGAGIH